MIVIKGDLLGWHTQHYWIKAGETETPSTQSDAEGPGGLPEDFRNRSQSWVHVRSLRSWILKSAKDGGGGSQAWCCRHCKSQRSAWSTVFYSETLIPEPLFSASHSWMTGPPQSITPGNGFTDPPRKCISSSIPNPNKWLSRFTIIVSECSQVFKRQCWDSSRGSLHWNTALCPLPWSCPAVQYQQNTEQPSFLNWSSLTECRDPEHWGNSRMCVKKQQQKVHSGLGHGLAGAILS